MSILPSLSTFFLSYRGLLFGLPVLFIFISLLLTRVCITLLPRWGFIDQNIGGRHIHCKPIPRGGGLAIIVTYCFGLLLFQMLLPQLNMPVFRLNHLKLFLPLLILVPTGLIDDKYGIPARWKLLAQLATALAAWLCGIQLDSFFGLQLPIWISATLTTLWIAVIINAFNLIDGIDGLASGVTVISAICLGGIMLLLKNPTGALLMFCLAGACLGFLHYNLHPASIFLGDTGSMFIGYMMGCLGIVTCTKLATIPALLIPVLACGIPILDISLAIWRRTTKKLMNWNDPSIGIMSPDREHLHHRLLKYYHNNQPKTVKTIYLLALMLGATALFSTFIPENLPILAFVTALVAFSLVIHRFAVIELWNSSRLFFGNFALARTGIILNILHPLWDLLVISVAFYLVADQDNLDIVYLAQWIAPVYLALLLSKTYQIFWNHPDQGDYFRLFRTLMLGFLVSWILNAISLKLDLTDQKFFFAFCITFTGLATERLGLYFVRMELIKQHTLSPLKNTTSINVVLFGVGLRSSTYLNYLLNHVKKATNEKILGLLDRDLTFRYGYCYGYQVLGTLDNLWDIYRKTPFQKIVICKADLSPSEKKLLEIFCTEKDIILSIFSYCETVEFEPEPHDKL
ncbi:MAG: MraY family glycosyltransferase [Lentisphaeria bacterium]